MGVSANFYTKKKISFDEAKEVIEREFGVPVEMSIKHVHFDNRHWCKFHFTLTCGEHRDLAFFPQSIDKQTWGTDDQIDVGEHPVFSLSMWGKSTEILTRIGQHFGGWLDYNDCDDELDVYIEDKVKKRNNAIDKILK
jgi:hypothetical protein